jgi:hypothetical protein
MHKVDNCLAIHFKTGDATFYFIMISVIVDFPMQRRSILFFKIKLILMPSNLIPL